MELSEELSADVQLCRTLDHVVVAVTNQEEYREGALLEPASSDLLGGCVVGIVDTDESRLFPEIIEYILERIDTAAGTWKE